MLDRVNFDEEPLSKEAYKREYDDLMGQLVVLQQRARSEGAGLAVLFEGWNGAGKGSRISDLMYQLDARATTVFVPSESDMGEPSGFVGRANGVTGYFPFMEPFWRALGERGAITFFDRGWYTAALQHMLAHTAGKRPPSREETRRYLESIHSFERQLADDGYTVVKFFLHVSKKAQRRRLERLHDDPATRWRVPDRKLASAQDYDRSYTVYDRLLENSDFDFAPWVLVNGEDKRRANITIARTMVEAISRALARREAELAVEKKPCAEAPAADMTAEEIAQMQSDQAPRKSHFPVISSYPRLDELDHTLTLDRDTYKKELKELQERLFRLENIMYQKRVPLILMYEGWDAAGKGGSIKRVAQALDARAYTIFPSPAPTKPELAHPHLWRYWIHLPKAGHVGIYDRSWYGRVLVERIEGFATTEQWTRAYAEINAFERDLVDWGAILLKFWVDVSQEEQLRRFEERQKDPAKQWKITEEDWRNREKYPQYKAAIDDMFRLTSTSYAPWYVLESDDKRYARVKALRYIVRALEERLGIE